VSITPVSTLKDGLGSLTSRETFDNWLSDLTTQMYAHIVGNQWW